MALLAVGCDARSLGLEAALRVAGAAYQDGPPPAASGGPEVSSLETDRSRVVAGEPALFLRGTLPLEANGVALFHPGDPGHWVLAAGPLDVFTRATLTLDARVSIAADAASGEFVIEARATDRAGRTGPAQALSVELTAEGLDDAPLSVTLSWDGPADLDLRVVDPSGVEIGVRNPNAWSAPAPGAAGDPEGWQNGARLEVDAQAGCTTAAAPRERVRWPVAPPSGLYTVRVDTYSLCGVGSAWWRITVTQRGSQVAAARGVSMPSDTRFSHDTGAGAVALVFELP